jgi:acetolactate synthase I/II/III large subunit
MTEERSLDVTVQLETCATSTVIASELATALQQAGVSLIFGVPGGGNNLEVISAAQALGCRFILAHGETAAVIMAGVTAELSGKPSACVVTRGPGAASAVNGVAQARLDRQAILLITDCVSDRDRRRVSHQFVDQIQMLGAVSKGSIVLGSSDSSAVAAAALRATVDGMPGPVHVEFDETAKGSNGVSLHGAPAGPPALGDASDASQLLERTKGALAAARRPVIAAGVGVVAGPRRQAQIAALRNLVADTTVPVLTTYKARGVISDRSPAAAGILTGGASEAPLLQHADVIIGIGLDPVELIPSTWEYEAPVHLIGPWSTHDVDYFGKHLVVETVVDLEVALTELKAYIHSTWQPEAANEYRRSALDSLEAATSQETSGITPQQVVTIANELAPPAAIATIDSGAHMLVAVPLWTVDEPGELVISSGLATMGFALPAAVAAALSCPDRHVVCFTGDGGLGMVLAELETLARLSLSVVVVVFNDETLSLIAIKQRDGVPTTRETVCYSPSDFAAVGSALGIRSAKVCDTETYSLELKKAFSHAGPTIIDVEIDAASYPAILAASRGSAAQRDGES